MNTCKTCQHWVTPKDNENPYRYKDLISPYDPVTHEQERTEEEIASKWGYNVRFCEHPKLKSCQRPDQKGFAVVDGSEYYVALVTGEDFGCILHEVKE